MLGVQEVLSSNPAATHFLLIIQQNDNETIGHEAGAELCPARKELLQKSCMHAFQKKKFPDRVPKEIIYFINPSLSLAVLNRELLNFFLFFLCLSYMQGTFLCVCQHCVSYLFNENRVNE